MLHDIACACMLRACGNPAGSSAAHSMIPLPPQLNTREQHTHRILSGNKQLQTMAGGANIHEAAVAGEPGALRTLLQRHPEQLNAADSEDRTALHLAAARGDCDSVGVLIDAGANLSLRNLHGETAFETAQRAGHRWTARQLLLASELVQAPRPEDAVEVELEYNDIEVSIWML